MRTITDNDSRERAAAQVRSLLTDIREGLIGAVLPIVI